MAASPGFAPGPPVSETDALLLMPRGSWPAEPKRDRQRLVAREGIAPSISGCRPDVILFHHRAGKSGMPSRSLEAGRRLADGDGFAPPHSPSKGDVLLVRRPGTLGQGRRQNGECRSRQWGCPASLLHSAFTLLPSCLVEPEVVAPSPRRSKSPVPVCCGFGSAKVVLAAGFAPASAHDASARQAVIRLACRAEAPSTARGEGWLGYASNGGMPWTCTTLPGFRGAHCLADRPGALVRFTFLRNSLREFRWFFRGAEKLALPAGLPPASPTFEASRSGD